MFNPEDLINNARYILNNVEAAAASLAFALPDRRYVTVGGSVYDCPQVTVSAMSSMAGLVSPDTNALQTLGPCPPIWQVTYEAAIVLRAAEATEGARGTIAPSVSKVESDTLNMSTAYAALINAIDLMTEDGIVGRLAATVQMGQPEGGLIAAVATIMTNLWFAPTG